MTTKPIGKDWKLTKDGKLQKVHGVGLSVSAKIRQRKSKKVKPVRGPR